METDYLKDVEIDKNALDIEWLNQSKLAIRYGKIWAEAIEGVQRAEENLKLVKAELIKKASKNPTLYLGSGVSATAANVESFYRKHKKHIAAKSELIEANLTANLADIIRKEISITRKAALQNLVELYNHDYFSVPREKSSTNASLSQKRVDRKIKNKINKDD